MKFVEVSAQVMFNGEVLYVQSQIDQEVWTAGAADAAVVQEYTRGLLKQTIADMILERLSPVFTVRIPEESFSDVLDRVGAEEWAGMTPEERRAAYEERGAAYDF